MNKNRFTTLLLCTVLTACSTTSNKQGTHAITPSQNKALNTVFSCKNAENYKDLVVGDGHCVTLIHFCANTPVTSTWKPGVNVMKQAPGNIKPGSIIATFLNGKYPNKTGWHAAIYIRHTAAGIWVWDQWKGKPVHKRLIRARQDGARPANTAQAYRLVNFSLASQQ